MRTRIAAAAIAAAALLALTACNSNDNNSDSKATSTPSVDISSAEAAAGIPPKPDAAKQAVLIAALQSIDPGLGTDPDKTIDAARNQCSTLNGSGDPTGHTAATRFGDDAHPLTDTQGMAINGALKIALCPKQ